MYAFLSKSKEKLPDDIITRKLLERKIPTQDDVKALLGDNEVVLKSFFFSLALLYDIPRREGMKPSFLHSYSAAGKPDYRYNDPKLPSRFKQTNFMKCLALIHELGEDYFGKDIAGSYVIEDIVKSFLGNELASGLEELTNNNDLVMESIKKPLERMDVEKYKRLEESDISRKLEARLDKLKISGKNVIGYYKRIKRKLGKFIGNIKSYHEELSNKDKGFIIDFIYNFFAKPLSTRLKEENIIDPYILTENVRNDFQYVIDMIKGQDYVEADPKLVHPFESPYIVTLDKTLYQDLLDNKIVGNAYKRLKEELAKGQLLDDSSLSVPIVKVSDSTATIATLETDIVHAIHQFRKARRVRETFRRLISRLKQEGINPHIYQRFKRAIDYQDKNLKLSIIEHYNYFKSKYDTQYSKDIELLEYMLGKESIKLEPKKSISAFKLI